jgi:hypothetical protein
LSKLLFDLYQEGFTPPQVNHVQSSRMSGLSRALRSTSLPARLAIHVIDVRLNLAAQRSSGLLAKDGTGATSCQMRPHVSPRSG